MKAAAHDADGPAHDAKMIEHGDERGEEDGGKNAEGEDESRAPELLDHGVAAKDSEEEADALVSSIDDALDDG